MTIYEHHFILRLYKTLPRNMKCFIEKLENSSQHQVSINFMVENDIAGPSLTLIINSAKEHGITINNYNVKLSEKKERANVHFEFII